MGGLLFLHEFAVAVVHQNGRVWIGPADDDTHLPDLVHRKGRPGGVAFGPLDEHHLHSWVGGGTGQPLQVWGVLRRQLHLAILNAVILQGAPPLVRDTDHPQQGVVGGAYGGQQHVPRQQSPVQGRGDGVGAVDKADTHQGVLRTEELRIDPV